MGQVLGFHIIGTTYGFSLPNDERGSGSDYMRSKALTKFGPANPVTHGRSVARKRFDVELRQMARDALMYPPVRLTDAQIASVAGGMGDEITRYNPAPVYSFACMRDHFHVVTGPCRYDVRRLEGRLKGAATKQLLKDGIHPLQRFAKKGSVPTPWGVNPWVAYLFTEDDVLRAIDYVEQNPVRAGLGSQRWDLVQPYHDRIRGAAHRR